MKHFDKRTDSGSQLLAVTIIVISLNAQNRNAGLTQSALNIVTLGIVQAAELQVQSMTPSTLYSLTSSRMSSIRPVFGVKQAQFVFM